MKTKLFFIAAFALLSTGLGAQPQGPRQEPPKMKDPAEMAKAQADLMQSEVGLDKKQYKKVYNLFKKDFQYRKNAMSQSFPGGGMGGPGGGMGGPGGGMGGPGGGMGGPGGGMGGPGGGMGGPGGGMGGPGGGMGGPGMGGMPPQGGMGPGGNGVTEEYLEKQDLKLKKILTQQQYGAWRAKHPAEHLDLPPTELEDR